MKLQTLLIIFPLLVAANRLAAPEALAEANALAEPDALAEALAEPVALAASRRASLEARAALEARATQTCAMTAGLVKYRKCPYIDAKKCPAIGETGAKGTKIAFKCWTTGTTVDGDNFWDKTTTGYYVPEKFVDPNCAIKLDQC